MRVKSVPVPTLSIQRPSGPEYLDYSIERRDEISIGINGRGYYIRLREDGTLVIRGAQPTFDPTVLAVCFNGRDSVALSVTSEATS